jgi:prepilin-type N-terminal cleavage/methylation domain-containing protein
VIITPMHSRRVKSQFVIRHSSLATAFTLIELMVVLALIAMLSALIIPEMKGTFEDALLRSTSRDLVNTFSIAASRAVSLNQLHRVRLDPKTGRYIIEKRIRETEHGEEFAPINVSESEGRLDTRISIQMRKMEEAPADSSKNAAPAPGSEDGELVDSISFNPDGTADRAVLVLCDRQGFRLALMINPITSRVKILQLERK